MTNYLIKQLFYFIPDIFTFFLVEKYRLLKTFDDGVVRQHAQLLQQPNTIQTFVLSFRKLQFSS